MKTFQISVLLVALLAMSAMFIVGCDKSDQSITSPGTSLNRDAISSGGPPPPKPVLTVASFVCAGSTPTSISVMITAGSLGAPAGFSLHWMLAADYAAAGNTFDESALSFCKASYSGNANNSYFSLPPDGYITITIGAIQYATLMDNSTVQLSAGSNGYSGTACTNDLPCNSNWVFEVFLHGNNDFSQSGKVGPLFCSTARCGGGRGEDGGCTYTQGYWKNHAGLVRNDNGGEGSIQPDAWPVSELTLGNLTYGKDALLDIFKTPVRGNGYISLAHQLMAAKLNIENGADPSEIADVIAAADAFIGDNNVTTASCPTSAVGEWVQKLDDWNNGVTGPGHCE